MKNRKKELIIFFTMLAAIAAVIGIRMQHLQMVAATPVLLPLPPKSEMALVTATATVAMVPPAPSKTPTPSAPPAPSVAPVTPIFAPTTSPPAPPPAPPLQTSSLQQTALPPKALPYSIGIFDSGFKAGDGWNNWWGGTLEANGVLTLGDATSSTGGGVLLLGSNTWNNYTFTVTFDWIQGQSFTMIGRYADNKNYLDCNFDTAIVGDLRITLEQHRDGHVFTLAHGDLQNYNQVGGNHIATALRVEGDAASCAFNNHVISTLLANDALVNPPPQGEIGFAAWDPIPGKSLIIVKTVSVTDEIYDLGSNLKSN